MKYNLDKIIFADDSSSLLGSAGAAQLLLLLLLLLHLSPRGAQRIAGQAQFVRIDAWRLLQLLLRRLQHVHDRMRMLAAGNMY